LTNGIVFNNEIKLYYTSSKYELVTIVKLLKHKVQNKKVKIKMGGCIDGYTIDVNMNLDDILHYMRNNAYTLG